MKQAAHGLAGLRKVIVDARETVNYSCESVGKYTGGSVPRLTAILLLVGAAVGAGAAPRGPDWRDAPEYLPIFAPGGSRARAYQVFVSPRGLDAVLASLDEEPGLLAPPGAWQPKPLLPFDAFGQTGRYDRWKLARLYGSRRAQVARGPRAADGRVTESWTLVSPYPDPSLTRLEPGTLLIVLSVP